MPVPQAGSRDPAPGRRFGNRVGGAGWRGAVHDFAGPSVVDGKHLAQLNIGRLVAEPGDARVAGFMGAIEQINGLGKRMPGFVWIMHGEGGAQTGNTGNAIGGDKRLVPNLTVWEDVAALETFVFNTVHHRFLERRAEWFEPMDRAHFVMWWVPRGHLPSLAEGLDRLAHLRAHGDSDHAFGWSWAKKARAHGPRVRADRQRGSG